MIDPVPSIDDVFIAVGGPAAFARGVTAHGVVSLQGITRTVKVSPSGAGEMKRRQSIPVNYWIPLVNFARSLDQHWITYEALTVMHTLRGLVEPQGDGGGR